MVHPPSDVSCVMLSPLLAAGWEVASDQSLRLEPVFGKVEPSCVQYKLQLEVRKVRKEGEGT